MGKIVEKVVAKKLFQYSERYFKLHPRQIEDQKDRSAINVIAIFVHIVQEK